MGTDQMGGLKMSDESVTSSVFLPQMMLWVMCRENTIHTGMHTCAHTHTNENVNLYEICTNIKG